MSKKLFIALVAAYIIGAGVLFGSIAYIILHFVAKYW